MMDLEQEQKSLELEIKTLESQVVPLQQQIKEKQERLSHILALRKPENENIKNKRGAITKRGMWAGLCRDYNITVGGDSAHRALLKNRPDIHATIPHNCNYENKMYL